MYILDEMKVFTASHLNEVENVALIYFRIEISLSIQNICFLLLCENYHTVNCENALTSSDSRSVPELNAHQ